ncbi:MAG: complex I NDUFA9 subunit family protein [Proteobacteria bacterium]|nr:complex I NDUFA9 subunit family protein [Pseudomonadota bacterium]
MTQRLVTVFGGSGFLGRYVVQKLAQDGHRVRVAVRNPNEALFLKPLGEVGQVQTVQANIRNEASVRRAVDGADGVVNLVGILFQSGKQKFNAVQAVGAACVATAATDAGVKSLVHLSAIGADQNARSKYARSKGAGEEAVRAAFPGAVVLRPSVMFGTEDNFFNRFAMLSKISWVLPLIGGNTRFQPVFVEDVAAAVVAALEGGDHITGQTFELGGPKVYTLRQMMELMMEVTTVKRLLIPVPFWFARMKAFFLQMLPNPLLTVDQVRLLENDTIVGEGARGLADLGITPTPAEIVLPTYLARFRPLGQFAENIKA